MKTRYTRTGFTVLEIIISVAIIAILVVVSTQVFFTTSRTNTKTEVQKEVKENGEYALEIMARHIRDAQSISTACSAGGSTSSSLTLVDQFNETVTFDCQISGGVERIASTSASLETTYLTNDTVQITQGCSGSPLMFTCTVIPNTPPRITVQFRLSQEGAPPDAFEQSGITFKTTVTARNIE